MALIAGIDIGNATTEVALAELSAGAAPVFIASSIVPTTGIKGTSQNTQGVFQALTIALDAAGKGGDPVRTFTGAMSWASQRDRARGESGASAPGSSSAALTSACHA